MSKETKSIGIQIGAISFLDEGVGQVLDTVADLGAVNTIYLNSFGYDIGLGGRQIIGYPYPGHGEDSAGGYIGGYCGKPNEQYYENTSIRPARDPDCDDRDLILEVVSEAGKRGMAVHAAHIDRFSSDFPGGDQVREVNHRREQTESYCMANPDYLNFWCGLSEDVCASYDLEGLLVFNERNGPLLSAIGATHYGVVDPRNTVCFCPHHTEIAHRSGIDVERARRAYTLLEALINDALKGGPEAREFFTEFLALLFEYPEIAAWEKLWTDTKYEFYRGIAYRAKKGRPDVKVGFHVSHVNSFNPIYRAEWSLQRLSDICDYLKLVVYHHAAGIRYRQFMKNLESTIFRDVPTQALFALNSHLLGYGTMVRGEDPDETPFPPEYVYKETARAKRLVGDSCLIYPGIGIDISHAHLEPEKPETIRAATSAALRAGADGLIYSRKYSEMRLVNLQAAGDAVREVLNER